MFGTFYSHTLLNFNQNGISNGLQKDFGKVFHIFEGMLNDIVQNNPFKTLIIQVKFEKKLCGGKEKEPNVFFR